MHRKHVINTLKKHLSKHFQFGYEVGNTFRLYSTRQRNVLAEQSVSGVKVGVLILKIIFEDGSSFKTYVQNLSSLTFGRGDNIIIINNSIRIPLEGKVCPAQIWQYRAYLDKLTKKED